MKAAFWRGRYLESWRFVGPQLAASKMASGTKDREEKENSLKRCSRPKGKQQLHGRGQEITIGLRDIQVKQFRNFFQSLK